jgi:hypothetical protein
LGSSVGPCVRLSRWDNDGGNCSVPDFAMARVVLRGEGAAPQTAYLYCTSSPCTDQNHGHNDSQASCSDYDEAFHSSSDRHNHYHLNRYFRIVSLHQFSPSPTSFSNVNFRSLGRLVASIVALISPPYSEPPHLSPELPPSPSSPFITSSLPSIIVLPSIATQTHRTTAHRSWLRSRPRAMLRAQDSGCDRAVSHRDEDQTRSGG